jgi:DNA uptake protein ComE-like DNA-binding protein
MAERLSKPGIAWYQLSRWEAGVIFGICLMLLFLCFMLEVSGGRLIEVHAVSQEVPPARLCVNTAAEAELTALPGIGQAKARRIVEARADGPISSFAELAEAAGGIPQAALERMEPFVVFETNEP